MFNEFTDLLKISHKWIRSATAPFSLNAKRIVKKDEIGLFVWREKRAAGAEKGLG
jgi:hypothetical protein